MRTAMVVLMGATLCGAQTIVNGGRIYLGTMKTGGSSASVDFSSAGSTAPVKTGLSSARATACTQGQIYFATDTPAGQNLSLCTTTGNPGVWSAIAGTGAGVSYCAPSGGSGSAYACAPNPAIVSYPAGFTVALVPDVNSTGGATTLNVSGQGAKPVKLADGATNPASGDLSAGRFYFLTFDGTAFRIGRDSTDASNITNGTLSDARLSSNVALGNRTNTFTGYNDLSTGSWRAPESTAAGLPAASGITGRIYVVTDALSTGSCNQGGGSLRTLCRSNGATYECIGNCTAGSGGGSGGTPGGSSGQLQYNNNGALGGLSNISTSQLPLSTITPAAGSTTTQAAFMCLDRTVATSDLSVAATATSITLGTLPAHFIVTDIWARETVSFAAPAIPTLTVSVGPSGAETVLLPAVNLKQAANTVASFGGGYAASDNTTAIVAQFIGSTSNLSTLTAGTWDVRVCGHLGR